VRTASPSVPVRSRMFTANVRETRGRAVRPNSRSAGSGFRWTEGAMAGYEVMAGRPRSTPTPAPPPGVKRAPQTASTKGGPGDRGGTGSTTAPIARSEQALDETKPSVALLPGPPGRDLPVGPALRGRRRLSAPRALWRDPRQRLPLHSRHRHEP